MTSKSLSRLIIHAPSIHCGGGFVLLRALMDELNGQKYQIVALLDTRLPKQINIPEAIQVLKFPPTIKGRFSAEKQLQKIATSTDVILCLGLPPLFKLPGKVILFLQNRLLLDVKLSFLFHFGFKVSGRIFFERIWLRFSKGHINHYIVQTPSMKKALQQCLNITQGITVQPFIASDQSFPRKIDKVQQKAINYDFVYVAAGDYHKNHHILIEAWKLLAEQGIYPSLCLTIDSKTYPRLWHWIDEQTQKYALKITNKGQLSHDKIIELYRQSGAMIFPSRLESLGLPLIEARIEGLPILASELDFVRDIIDPEETFDPLSALSINRAVRRFLSIEQENLTLVNAEEFLKTIVINQNRQE